MNKLKNPPKNWKDGLKDIKALGSITVITFFLFGILLYFTNNIYSSIGCFIFGILIIIAMLYQILLNKEIWYRTYDWDYNLHNNIITNFEEYLSIKNLHCNKKGSSSLLKKTQESNIYEIDLPNNSNVLVRIIYQQSHKVGGTATGLKIANIEILKINNNNIVFVNDLIKVFNDTIDKQSNQSPSGQ